MPESVSSAKSLSRKSPHQEWVAWAHHLIENFPASLDVAYFCSYFISGLGTQNVQSLIKAGLLIGTPNPDPEDFLAVTNKLDIFSLLMMIDRLEVPKEAREIVYSFLHNEGYVRNPLHDEQYFIPKESEF